MAEQLPYPVALASITAIPANQEPREVLQPQDVAWSGMPVMYPGPVSRQLIANPQVVCKGRDNYWLRPTSFNAGADVRLVEQGFIEGIVTINGVGVARRKVMCLDEGFDPVDEVWTDDQGRYRFDLLWLGKPYVVMAMDSNNDKYAPAAADRRLPEAYQ